MTDTTPDAAAVLETLLFERYSCRSFLPQPVPRARIEKMLSLAQRSASWCNTQPWRLTITEGAGTERFRQAFYDHAASQLATPETMTPDFAFPLRYNGIHDQRRKEVGGQLYSALGIERGDRAGAMRQALENFRFFGAPHALVIHVDRDLGDYGAIDCGVFLGTLLLAAQSLGIAMVPQAAMASYSAFIRDYFDIPDNMACVAGASFGFADAAHPANSFRSSRGDAAEDVRWVTS